MANGGNAGFYFNKIMDPEKGNWKRRAAYKWLYWLYKLLEQPLRIIRVPIEAFFPYTYLAISKNSSKCLGA